ncbi:hypothetical protein GCM10022237_43070 [Nocardioides ginsengisoli]
MARVGARRRAPDTVVGAAAPGRRATADGRCQRHRELAVRRKSTYVRAVRRIRAIGLSFLRWSSLDRLTRVKE